MKYLALIIALLCATVAPAAPPANFDERVESLRNSLGVPGVSIAIVENGRTTLAKGYGIRKLGQPERVGPDTIFQTGSTGKAFTVAALAILADQGKLNWDDKVIDHMPDFRMFDPLAARTFQSHAATRAAFPLFSALALLAAFTAGASCRHLTHVAAGAR